MAVQDEDSFKRYVANGVATVYAIPFLLLNAADLQVVLDDVEVTTGFTVTGVGTNTGSITFSVAPSGDLLLQRVVPFERLADYQDNGDLLADTVNRDLDRLWLAMQELRRDDSTALRTSSLEPEGIPNLPLAAQRSSRVLAFGPTGDPVVSSLTIDELEQQPALAIAAADTAVAAAGAASSSASASSASATASANSAIAADQAKDKAQQWAEEAEDVPVEPGLFSAKHWALKSEQALSDLDSRVGSLEAKPPIGWNQTWQDLTASRALATTYTNSTGRPIMVVITTEGTTTGIALTVNGVVIQRQRSQISSGTTNASVSAIIPSGATYSAANIVSGTLSLWSELR